MEKKKVKSEKKKAKADIKGKPKVKIQKQQLKKEVKEKPKIKPPVQPKKSWWKKDKQIEKPTVPIKAQFFDKQREEKKMSDLLEEDSDIDITDELLRKSRKDIDDKLKIKPAILTNKFWWSKKKKEDKFTEPKQPVQLYDDKEATEKVSDAHITDEEFKKTIIDSDYYSTDTSTDYSYSYQDDKTKYDAIPQAPIPFKDVEKQEIPDYASMESYREGSEEVEDMKKTKGTYISKTVLDKSKPERHVDFIGVPTTSKEKPKPKSKKKKKIKKKGDIIKVADDTDTGSETEFQDETPLMSTHLKEAKIVKKESELSKLVTDDAPTKKLEPFGFSRDETDMEAEKELIKESGSIEARLKKKDQPQRTKLPYVQPAICICSETDEEIQDLNPVDSSLVSLPPQSTTGVNTTNINEYEFEKKLDEIRNLQLKDVPTLSEICTCKKYSQRFSHVQYEEISESPRSTFSSNNLTSSSLISLLSDYNSEQFMLRPKKKNVHRKGPSVNYVEMVYDTFPSRREIEVGQRNRIRQYYKAVKDIPAKRVTSFSTPSKIRAMVEKILQKVCCIQQTQFAIEF